ncbi:MAG TPA: hypothetical protein VFU63_14275 [Ktedonobacterales bacterium]|nr:hypothetical protein [Ktedonobacterales bacterium]
MIVSFVAGEKLDGHAPMVNGGNFGVGVRLAVFGVGMRMVLLEFEFAELGVSQATSDIAIMQQAISSRANRLA